MKVRVRENGGYRQVDASEFDPVPCRMRLTMPGTSRLVNPVPGRPNGVSRNTDVLVWCDCMAQTAEQLTIAREVAETGSDPDDVAWPSPKHQRGWDVLGAVQTVLVEERVNSGGSTRGRRSNPDAMAQARKMWDEHRQIREQGIAQRRRAT